MEPLAIAHLMPIQAGSSDPRLREDEVNPFPEEVISSLSWPIDEETGMPRIPVQPGLDPWEIVSHL